MKIVTVNQMQAIEKNADMSGVSYRQMMENAGLGIAEWIYKHYSKIPNVVGLVGSGNNGGDTLIALTMLSKLAIRTTGFLVKKRKKDDLFESYIQAGGSIIDISDGENIEYLDTVLIRGTIILDGVLGTGLKLPLRGQLEDVMGKISHLVENRPGMRVVAVDCPSGIDCDTGEAFDRTLFADNTLCMAAVKQGLLKHPAREKSGKLHFIDIGIGDLSQYSNSEYPEMITEEIVKQCLPDRPGAGHKGTFGTCLVIAGTPGYTGAAYLTGKSAYRAGCGLVDMATMKSVQENLAGHLVEAVWTILPGFDGNYDPHGVGLLEEKISQIESLVMGPGWGLNDSNEEFLRVLLNIIPKNLPTVIDADGLKLLRRIQKWWRLIPNTTILTPHPGEMAILGDLEINDIQSNRWEVAKEFAIKWGVTIILKGAETVIADQDGHLWINPVSEPALATAGSGDILSGLLGGLLAQSLSTPKAAVVSAWLHGQAGILAKDKLGTNISVTAIDILDSLAESFSKIGKGKY